MSNNRNLGIDIVGDVSWGMHLCQFYHTKQDLLDVLVPYFKAGLKNNEFCMWITSEPLKVGAAKAALKKVVKNLDHFIKKGQIEILDYSEWYTKSGKFDANNVLQGWVEKENQALKRGYDGLRLSGNTFWLETKDWKEFAEYEAKVDSAIRNYRMIAVCTYSLDKCVIHEILDVVRNHRFAIIKQAGRLDLIESTERTRAEEAVRKSEEKYRSLTENVNLGIYRNSVGPKDKFIEANPAIIGMFGYKSKEEFLAIKVSDLYQHAEDRNKFNDKLLKEGFVRGEELWLKKKDGSLFVGSVSAVAVKDERGHVKYYDGIIENITERKRAEEALRESEEKYRSLASTADSMYLVDRECRYIFMNEGQLSRFDLSLGEVIGRSYGEFHSEEDTRQFAENVKRVFETGKSFQTEHKSRRDNKYFLRTFSPVVNSEGSTFAITVVSKDIMERKRAEEKLRETNEYLENLFNYANAPIIVWNKEFKIARFNHAFETLTGRKAAEVIGKPIELLFPPEQVNQSMELIIKTLKGERWEIIEIPIMHLDGSVRTVLWNSANILVANGKTPVATIAQGQDITERKRAEAERERLLADLEAKNIELESFVSTVSHDLKAPLVSLNGFSSVLQKEYENQLAEKGKHYLERIQANVAHMDALITSLLELSCIGQVVGAIEEMDVAALLREIRDALAIRLKEAGAEFIVQEPLPTVRADRARIRQVFANLIDNAVKFRSTERALRIEVGCRQESGFYRFHVADNGIGIAPQYHEQIFAPFQKLHSEIEGVGIRLALVKKIVEHHGGRVWVESPSTSLSAGNEGEGATFFFTLPIERGVKSLS